MTIVRNLTALACTASILTACASQTVIRSNPSGAKVYIDNSLVGTTPYTLSDTKIVGSSTAVRLEYPGLQPTAFTLSRNEELKVGPLIAGLFLLVPLLWVMGYKADHTIELRGPERSADPNAGDPYNTAARNRAVELQQVDQQVDQTAPR